MINQMTSALFFSFGELESLITLSTFSFQISSIPGIILGTGWKYNNEQAKHGYCPHFSSNDKKKNLSL